MDQLPGIAQIVSTHHGRQKKLHAVRSSMSLVRAEHHGVTCTLQPCHMMQQPIVAGQAERLWWVLK
eukprot:5056364-Prorocentrum_lima.AAC.1